MSRPTENAGLKRKRAPTAPVAHPDNVKVLNAIKSKQGMGIWLQDIKRQTNLLEPVVKKSIKSLLAAGKIKEVVNIKYKRGKHYMAIEFQPSDEISGGVWYNAQGHIDNALLDGLKMFFLDCMNRSNLVTSDALRDMVNKSKSVTFECSNKHVDQVLKYMVSDNQIQEVESNGTEEFGDIPKGTVCYKVSSSKDAPEKKPGAMASIPCGMCPRISICTVDGVISPSNCVYYKEWLKF